MLDEVSIRRIFRDEIKRLIKTKPLLTIPECIKRYGHAHPFYLALIQRGELQANHVAKGRNGRPQWYIKAESAEQHPELGGGLS